MRVVREPEAERVKVTEEKFQRILLGPLLARRRAGAITALGNNPDPCLPDPNGRRLTMRYFAQLARIPACSEEEFRVIVRALQAMIFEDSQRARLK